MRTLGVAIGSARRSRWTTWARRLAAARFGIGLCVGAGAAVATAVATAAALAGDARPAARSSETPLLFSRDVRPILAANCFKCHGPDPETREGKLRLDTREGATAERARGVAVAPGNADGSLLIQRLLTDDPDKRMPPPEVNAHGLSADQREVLRRWINEGAVWGEHWSFVPPRALPPPNVNNAAWCRSPLDAWVLAQLERHALRPSPEADRPTLIRRVSLDLVGLPPTPAEVDAFCADTSADAYERVVDRLLASPHYGEKWARWWLDLARYADTKGYEKDDRRTVWPYRDWVVRALNADMPFDQFTLEQLAGDMPASPTTDQIIATAFHRNTMTNDEGGTDDEEFRTAAVIDRVNTTMEVWQGLTVGCAQCHAHKFDPIPHADYYRLFAIFNGTEDTDANPETPFLSVPHGDAALSVPVMRELPEGKRRATHVLQRGSFLSPGERVEPGVPGAFACVAAEPVQTRADLARWLMHERNPLTARVLANRIWEQVFGIGLVETTEDVGTQGAWPANLELLDTLAIGLREGRVGSFGGAPQPTGVDGGHVAPPTAAPTAAPSAAPWSLKAFLRAVVTTATYRQSSRLTAELLARDPYNRLLARGPRFRLDGESVRDQALAISGLLSPTLGGPPVFPPQPDGLWIMIYSGDAWKNSTGSDRHRRALYTFWRRTVPYPSMTTFDAPTRDVCTSRRIRTNTPLQAFVTLNDPAFVECAQAMARRVLAEGGPDDASRAAYAMRLAVARPPSSDEAARVAALVGRERERFAAMPESAIKAATVPLGAAADGVDTAQLAAWTTACSVILNLDEVLTKD